MNDVLSGNKKVVDALDLCHYLLPSRQSDIERLAQGRLLVLGAQRWTWSDSQELRVNKRDKTWTFCEVQFAPGTEKFDRDHLNFISALVRDKKEPIYVFACKEDLQLSARQKKFLKGEAKRIGHEVYAVLLKMGLNNYLCATAQVYQPTDGTFKNVPLQYTTKFM